MVVSHWPGASRAPSPMPAKAQPAKPHQPPAVNAPSANALRAHSLHKRRSRTRHRVELAQPHLHPPQHPRAQKCSRTLLGKQASSSPTAMVARRASMRFWNRWVAGSLCVITTWTVVWDVYFAGGGDLRNKTVSTHRSAMYRKSGRHGIFQDVTSPTARPQIVLYAWNCRGRF